MTEHTAGQIGVIGGAIVAAGLLIAGGLLYLALFRGGALDIGPAGVGLGVCLTPIVVGFGAWLGSFVLRQLIRLSKS